MGYATVAMYKTVAGYKSGLFAAPLGLLALFAFTGCFSRGEKEPMLSHEEDLNQEQLEQPFSKALADLNDDGHEDILIGDYGDKIYAYQYPTWERFVLNENNGGDDIRSVDIDGDGFNDILSNGSRIAWYRNPGKESSAKDGDWVLDQPWEEHVIRNSTRSHDLVVGKIDDDDRIDVGIRVENGPSMLFLQQSDDKWTQVPLTQAEQGVGMDLADMDGDGRMDVLGSGYWLKQPEDPAAGEWEKQDVAPDWPQAAAVTSADFNKDGRPDLVLAGAYNKFRLSWFEGADSDTWTEHVIADVSHVHRFHITDVDGDGEKDVIFAEQHQSSKHRVGVMLNTDGEGLNWQMRIFSNQGGHNIAVGDVENDGKLEVLAVNWTGDTRVRLLSDLLLESKKSSWPGLISQAALPDGGSPASAPGL